MSNGGRGSDDAGPDGSGYLLAVDLGTTFTAAAVVEGRARPTMVGLGNRALQIPSVLFRTDEGFLVGESAERRGQSEPDRLVREFKRRLGDNVPVLVGGAPFTPEALMARLLTWVLERTTERMGQAPDGLVLTHPAGWQGPKLDRLRDVVALAEAPPTRFCPEPTAAAAQYASRAKVEPGDRLAVYDLGGGTFDVCVLEKTGEGFRVLGQPGGVEHLGGVDFDALLFRHVLGSLVQQGGAEPGPDDPTMTNALQRLRRDCVEAKEGLSSDVVTAVPLALPGVVRSIRVTRGELESLVRPAIEQSMTALGRALRWAGVQPSALHAIILVGGSSRIPLVGELLQAEFRVPVALDTHPKHDIALGALRGATSAPPDVRPKPHGRQTGTAPGAPVVGGGGAPPSGPGAGPGPDVVDDDVATASSGTGARVGPGVGRRRAVLVPVGLVVVAGLVAAVLAGRPDARPSAVPAVTAEAASTTPLVPPCGWTDEFEGPLLDRAWSTSPQDARVRVSGGAAEVTSPEGADLFEDRLGAPTLWREVVGDFSIETAVRAAPEQFYQGAGVVIRSGKDYVRLELGHIEVRGPTFVYKDGGPHVRVVVPRRGPDLVQTSASDVVLQLSRTGSRVSARWRPASGAGFAELGTVDVTFPSRVRAGVAVLDRAQGDSRPEPFAARFDRVTLRC